MNYDLPRKDKTQSYNLEGSKFPGKKNKQTNKFLKSLWVWAVAG